MRPRRCACRKMLYARRIEHMLAASAFRLKQRLPHDALRDVLAPHRVALVARVDAVARPVPAK